MKYFFFWQNWFFENTILKNVDFDDEYDLKVSFNWYHILKYVHW